VASCSKADGDLDMLKSQILVQPVIVGFDATDVTFMQHGAGLYTPNKCTTTKLNHYMLAVGWGQETTGVVKTTYYYIWVKNSFGTRWGDDGYGKIVVQQNKKETGGCGMMTYVFFPYG
jgi:cathepsin L